MDKKLIKQLYKFVDSQHDKKKKWYRRELLEMACLADTRAKYLHRIRLLQNIRTSWYTPDAQYKLERLSRTINNLLEAAENEKKHNAVYRYSTADATKDLVRLIEDGKIIYNPKRKHILITTERIVLEGIDLGPFEIRIGENPKLEVVALDPNPAIQDESVTHPHVSGGNLCLGEAKAAFEAAVHRRDFYSQIDIVLAVIREYNEDGPYIPLDEWHTEKARCEICEQDYDLTICNGCERTICCECEYWCEHCERSYCANCSTRCSGCSETICAECTYKCKECDNAYCKSCMATDEICECCFESGDCDCSVCGYVDASSYFTECPHCNTTICPDCECDCEPEEEKVEGVEESAPMPF